MAEPLLLEVTGVAQAFPKPGGRELVVLDGLNMTLKTGEIVGLVGRSGSGKSTFLRLVAGLARPTRGEVRYLGNPVTGPAEGVAMVFQSFALFPWLTVLENVQLGLEAMKLPADEIRKRALSAIDLIGLDGFESAYPRELSGGMRQRVGVARALVMHPNILLMDEPFSALDVLTAETLRTDLVELWEGGQLPIKSVILVTHNIEEAVLMCDRILVFANNPGRVAAEIKVPLPRPRLRTDLEFQAIVDRIYVEMTARARAAAQPKTESAPTPQADRLGPIASLNTPLPRLSTNLMAGFLEALAVAPYNGKADLPHLAHALLLEADELFPMAETLQLLRFVNVEGGDVHLTEEGRHFVDSDVGERKKIFARHLMFHVPLVAHIRRVLDERASHTAPRSRFSDELEDHMSAEYAETTLRAATSWARYAELFAYDDKRGLFTLENPS